MKVEQSHIQDIYAESLIAQHNPSLTNSQKAELVGSIKLSIDALNSQDELQGARFQRLGKPPQTSEQVKTQMTEIRQILTDHIYNSFLNAPHGAVDKGQKEVQAGELTNIVLRVGELLAKFSSEEITQALHEGKGIGGFSYYDISAAYSKLNELNKALVNEVGISGLRNKFFAITDIFFKRGSL